METIQFMQDEGQIAGDFCAMRCEQLQNLLYSLNYNVIAIQTVSLEG